MSEPVWHLCSARKGIDPMEIFPQRAVWAGICAFGFVHAETFIPAFACLMCAGMMFGSIFQRHRLAERRNAKAE